MPTTSSNRYLLTFDQGLCGPHSHRWAWVMTSARMPLEWDEMETATPPQQFPTLTTQLSAASGRPAHHANRRRHVQITGSKLPGDALLGLRSETPKHDKLIYMVMSKSDRPNLLIWETLGGANDWASTSGWASPVTAGRYRVASEVGRWAAGKQEHKVNKRRGVLRI